MGNSSSEILDITAEKAKAIAMSIIKNPSYSFTDAFRKKKLRYVEEVQLHTSDIAALSTPDLEHIYVGDLIPCSGAGVSEDVYASIDDGTTAVKTFNSSMGAIVSIRYPYVVFNRVEANTSPSCVMFNGYKFKII